MTDHYLHREVIERRQYPVVRNGDCELMTDTSTGGEFMDTEEQATIECTCGESFRKEKTALEHLKEVNAET